jgi:hypothetical protein
MREETISNEVLYEMMKDFKDEVFRRFEGVNHRFEDMNSKFGDRFEDMNSKFGDRFENMRHDIRDLQQKVDKIYESRDKVKVDFTRAWTGVSLFMMIGVALLVSLFGRVF